MKKLIYIMLGVLLIAVTSCIETDNWAGPNARVHGRIIDSTTGENLLASQNDWGIRIWERSWTASTPTSQSLSVMQDGSYNNTKLFKGTYDMLPYGGAFWPIDTIKNVAFNGDTQQDFTVTPYLQLQGFETSLVGLKLTMSCQLKASIREGLPDLVELKPFLSLNQFCGASNFIDVPEYNKKKVFNKPWMDEVGDVETSKVYVIGPIDVKPGYTYYVRLGANVNDANKKYNYTKIVKIEVPADAKNGPDEFHDFANGQWPFAKDDWDGNRWGNLKSWTTNEAMRTRDGRGGYDGGWDGPDKDKQCLGFEKWGDGETNIINGKLFQTFDLPAGSYKVTLSFAGDCPIKSNNGINARYLVAAEGETLPDIANINTALDAVNFAGVNQDTGVVTIEFSLSAPKKVSAGFVANFDTKEQNVRPSWIKLEKVN